MVTIINPHNIPSIIAQLRINRFDPLGIVVARNGWPPLDALGSVNGYLSYFEVESNLDISQIQDLLFLPITTTEQLIITDYISAPNEFNSLPNWSTWTALDVETNLTDLILHGWDKTTANTQIDALPATIAGMKIGLKEMAGAIIDIRTILIVIGKAIVYFRNFVIKIR